jgi:hypothetical protein
VKGLQDALRADHHFTTAYTPWANGTVERVGREVLRATRALLSEYRTAPKCMGDDHTYIAIHFE